MVCLEFPVNGIAISFSTQFPELSIVNLLIIAETDIFIGNPSFHQKSPSFQLFIPSQQRRCGKENQQHEQQLNKKQQKYLIIIVIIIAEQILRVARKALIATSYKNYSYKYCGYIKRRVQYSVLDSISHRLNVVKCLRSCTI